LKKTPIATKSFAKIEKELRALKCYGPHSFASLNKPDDSFVQVAGGRVTCVLEMREMPSEKLWRAYMDEPRVPFKGLQTLMFGGGRLEKFFSLMMLFVYLERFFCFRHFQIE
jgi:hypothetical protein